jgi:hypothetical protein
MNNRLEKLLEEIKALEFSITEELRKKKDEFSYEINKRRIQFTEEVVFEQKQKIIAWHKYIMHARLRNILTFPIIWLNLFPAIFIDLVVTFFQLTCFPIYGIPKVKRSDYVIIDRQYLPYLNIIEKLNCIYCGYFNGVLAYVTEVAARTEQYWCPIKHALKMKSNHSRYSKFSDFGDGENYQEKMREIRKDFDDLKP